MPYLFFVEHFFEGKTAQIRHGKVAVFGICDRRYSADCVRFEYEYQIISTETHSNEQTNVLKSK